MGSSGINAVHGEASHSKPDYHHHSPQELLFQFRIEFLKFKYHPDTVVEQPKSSTSLKAQTTTLNRHNARRRLLHVHPFLSPRTKRHHLLLSLHARPHQAPDGGSGRLLPRAHLGIVSKRSRPPEHRQRS